MLMFKHSTFRYINYSRMTIFCHVVNSPEVLRNVAMVRLIGSGDALKLPPLHQWNLEVGAGSGALKGGAEREGAPWA